MALIRARCGAEIDPPNCRRCGLSLPEIGEPIAVQGAGRYHLKCWSDRHRELHADATSEAAQVIPPAKNGRVKRSGKPDS